MVALKNKILVLIFVFFLIGSAYAIEITDLTDVSNQIGSVGTATTNSIKELSARNELLTQKIEALSTDLKAFQERAITKDDLPAIFEDIDRHNLISQQQIVTSNLVVLLLMFACLFFAKSKGWL